MKKFDLSKLNLSANEVLQRSEMKKITGGYSGGMIQCSCSTSSGTKTATCTSDLVAWGGHYCCQASYGSGSTQSGC